jgi:hypothetical protein
MQMLVEGQGVGQVRMQAEDLFQAGPGFGFEPVGSAELKVAAVEDSRVVGGRGAHQSRQ